MMNALCSMNRLTKMWMGSPMRWRPVALTPVLLLLLASAGLGQERSSCAELCRFDPLNVPPECTCTGAAGGSGGVALSPLEMTAGELLEWEQAYYAERMAPIDNYWVVVKSNISPIEEVRYFEKEGTADEPYFRMIPINELAQRETLANPESGDFERMAAEDPAAVLGAFADAYDMMAASPELNANTGGAASGLLGALADGLRDAGGGIDETKELMEEDREGEMYDLGRMFHRVSNNVSETIKWAMYYPEGQTPAQRFGDPFPRPPGYVPPEWVERERDEGGVLCAVVTLHVPFDYEDPDGTTYTVEHAERWVGLEVDSPPFGVYVRMEVRAMTAGGFQRAVIERETDHYRDDGPLIPHRTRSRFSGALMEVVEVVKHIQSNTGPPSQVEIAQRTVNSIGAASGADPSVP